ncbi:RMI1, partial [Cordylochernes scorpioides]
MDQSLSPDQVKDAMYTQWLYSDLQVLECPSLPPGLFTTEKYFLEGRYTLQVRPLLTTINYMYDISRSAYSQLTKLTGLANENAEVTAAPADEPPPPWEVKPTRMLLINFTDGVNSIDGFEFSPINCLHLSLPPGTKVCLAMVQLSLVLTLGQTTPPFLILSCVCPQGFIVTLVSKLELTSGQWSIQAIVTDGSASLHVSLHDQLLSKLIGYTAQEVMDIKSRQDQQHKKQVMA